MKEKLIPLPLWAEQRGIPGSTARKMAEDKEIPARKLGRYWYVVEETEDGSGQGRIFTLFNHAGGVGKTTLARDLGFELASRGHRVLLVDVDPQANLTQWLGVDAVEEKDTLLSLANGVLPEPREAYGMHLIPSSLRIAVLDVKLKSIPAGELLLRRKLHAIRTTYDFILVDSPPSLGPLSFLAGLAGEGFIVPVETTAKGLQGLNGVMEVSELYATAAGMANFIRLLVPTRYDPRSRTAQEALEGVERLARRFSVAPPLHERPGPFRRSAAERMPIHMVEGAQEAVREIRDITDALLRVAQEVVA
ncbi:ParA family protein [Meiothermus taiwanensis]|jgi:chromosome partitioning protein|uniref:Sporulation initiation inhibitor protein Soj n=2 Tax=Meiothermus taiwanensis TaxID=172827 RepID=A0A399DYD1_9DEIN|nr:ParA family protein [Meiothermus taiwanensis]AWR88071.1 chromosome partitioning ATPase, ParA [Meiothermus taiwanensis WR-220]KIQ53647.1 chromosome partitioning protein [Meiothermus taiwanensis]KZK16899.1 chromosome partitioning protein [Meiothermus taiwanensis]RIH77187.1 Sporulation initiation inhibitor protein Soj [Meiothermus taiwanensis]